MLKSTLNKLILALAIIATPSAFALDLSLGVSAMDVEDYDAAVGPSIKVGVPVSEWIDAEAGASWLMGEEDNQDYTLVPLDLGLKAALAKGCTLNPYVKGGASYMLADFDANDNIDGGWGAYAGAGVEYPVSSSLSLYTEAVYRWAGLDDLNSGDQAYAAKNGNQTDDEANGTQATVGLTYTFGGDNM